MVPNYSPYRNKDHLFILIPQKFTKCFQVLCSQQVYPVFTCSFSPNKFTQCLLVLSANSKFTQYLPVHLGFKKFTQYLPVLSAVLVNFSCPSSLSRLSMISRKCRLQLLLLYMLMGQVAELPTKISPKCKNFWSD